MWVINGLTVRIFTGTALRTWEWTTNSGDTHRITWLIGGRTLLYGLRAEQDDGWNQRLFDHHRWSVPNGTFAAAQQRVEEFLTEGGRAA